MVEVIYVIFPEMKNEVGWIASEFLLLKQKYFANNLLRRLARFFSIHVKRFLPSMFVGVSGRKR